jgi:hypothetical protein
MPILMGALYGATCCQCRAGRRHHVGLVRHCPCALKKGKKAGQKKARCLSVAGESNSRRVGGDRKNITAPQQIPQLYSGDDTYSQS